MSKPKLILMVGNIGSGKSTYVKNFVKEGYVVISKDDIRYMIGAGSYIFNPDYEEAIHEAAMELFWEFLEKGVNIVIDETNMDVATRKIYLSLAYSSKYTTEAIVMPKLSMAESVKRRLGANHGNASKEVWEEVYTRKEAAFEMPTLEEGFDSVITMQL
ncbi:hypothetical protein LCGC14_0305930 [marine sediment metagenome]|uniref:Zeta toxin domain-containing protein n=1 Tax=marine sediment metagenome TaxID=412755 RepID=A0A0F9TTX8_9ZZZZ